MIFDFFFISSRNECFKQKVLEELKQEKMLRNVGKKKYLRGYTTVIMRLTAKWNEF